MQIVWDEPKRQANIAKHGLDFASLTLEFFESAVIADARQGRYLAIGKLNDALVIATIFRPLGTEAISIISMRRAGKAERSLL